MSTKNQLEDITRAAAHAIGREVADYRWDERVKGLIHGDDPEAPRADYSVFAPLTDPCDAYMIEDALQMTVTYRAWAEGVVTLHVTSQKHDGAIMQTVRPPTDTLSSRMYAITQFAALHDIMLDEVAHG